MLRTITFAAAAALFATAASAEDSIHIPTAGKTPAQLKSEVVATARKLCFRETVGSSFETVAYASCVDATIKATLAQPAAQKLALASR